MSQAEEHHWFIHEVQPHEKLLRAYLLKQYPTLEDVDDVIQEAYVRLLRYSKAKVVKEPKALLFTIARNLVYDLFRRRKVVQFERLATSPALFLEEDGLNVVEQVAVREEINLLVQAVESLPKRCRAVMTLRMVYGYRTKEIAKELGISSNTVKAQLAKGMRRSAAFLMHKGQKA